MNHLADAVRRFTTDLMTINNVVGVGWGHREVGNIMTDEPCMVVLVREKKDHSVLPREQIVPRSLGNVVTDVVEVGDLKFLTGGNQRHSRLRPAPGGVSVGHIDVSAGTLGGIVRDRGTGRYLILSNNHVLANITDGRDGRAAVGDPILQPGAHDGGKSDDVIGHLSKFVPLYRQDEVPTCPLARRVEAVLGGIVSAIMPRYRLTIKRLTGQTNLVDAAVATIPEDDLVSPEILDIGHVQGTARAEPGMDVQKSGRTSGITTGRIRAVGATLEVHMGDAGVSLFRDQIVTTPMASPGDSGSLLLSHDNRVVGLLFGGSSLASIHCRIDHVLELLDIEVITPGQ